MIIAIDLSARKVYREHSPAREYLRHYFGGKKRKRRFKSIEIDTPNKQEPQQLRLVE